MQYNHPSTFCKCKQLCEKCNHFAHWGKYIEVPKYIFCLTYHSALNQLCPYRAVMREAAGEQEVYGLSFPEAYNAYNKVFMRIPTFNAFLDLIGVIIAYR